MKLAPEPFVRLLGGRLVVALPDGAKRPERVRDALTGWLHAHAEAKPRQKAEQYAKIVGLARYSVGIKSFKSRWGSCCTTGLVQFNWRIIITPNRVVDYVVAHELCHLKQHDHSPKIWKCMERVFPDFLKCRDCLKVNGKTLTV